MKQELVFNQSETCKIKNFGQVFTPHRIVKLMINLIKNKGSILEPSAGTGSFLNELPEHAIGLEIDRSICSKRSINMDFFDYSIENKFDTIIGNPPYVRFQDIEFKTKKNYMLICLIKEVIFIFSSLKKLSSI